MGILPNLVGTVEAVCVGAVGEIDSGRRKIVSSLIKTPVQGRIAVGPLGLPGDEHVYEDHGGPDLALLAYPREHYDHWRDIGLELPVAGAMGENLTTTGLVETEVHIGDVFEVGTSVIQVTETRSPCSKLAARFGRKDMAVMMQDTGFTGFSVPRAGVRRDRSRGHTATATPRRSSPDERRGGWPDPQRRPQGSCRRAAPLRRASPRILGPPEARDSPRKTACPTWVGYMSSASSHPRPSSDKHA